MAVQGIVTQVSLCLQPTFFIRQRCFEGLQLRSISSQAVGHRYSAVAHCYLHFSAIMGYLVNLLATLENSLYSFRHPQQAHLNAVLGAAYSVSLWTTWLPPGPAMMCPTCKYVVKHQNTPSQQGILHLGSLTSCRARSSHQEQTAGLRMPSLRLKFN